MRDSSYLFDGPLFFYPGVHAVSFSICYLAACAGQGSQVLIMSPLFWAVNKRLSIRRAEYVLLRDARKGEKARFFPGASSVEPPDFTA